MYLCIHLTVPWSRGLGVEGMEFMQLIQSSPPCTLPLFHLPSPPQRSNSHCLSNITLAWEKVTHHHVPQLKFINKRKSGSPNWVCLVLLRGLILKTNSCEDDGVLSHNSSYRLILKNCLLFSVLNKPFEVGGCVPVNFSFSRSLTIIGI